VYLELTGNNKAPRTLKRDEYLLDVAFGFFKKRGATILDDVVPLDCVSLISWLKAKGLKRSSIQNYWKSVSKIYTKLRQMKLIKLDNPMEDVELPKDGNMVRERIPTIEEVQSILSYLDAQSVKSTYVSPLNAIIRFALYTGSRIGEVLHAEWGEFNFETGYWHLKRKPDCPGIEGMGWSPKWGKSRFVKLFPEALSILEDMPPQQTVGYIKGDNGNHLAIPAKFVFPKKQVLIADNCKMKSKSGHYKCIRCREYEEKELCEHRIVVYSRCDSVQTAWGSLCRNTGIKDLHIHDLRQFFNRVILQEKLGFTPEESGHFIGNSEGVNREHYSPISIETFDRKISQKSFGDLINGQDAYLNCKYLEPGHRGVTKTVIWIQDHPQVSEIIGRSERI